MLFEHWNDFHQVESLIIDRNSIVSFYFIFKIIPILNDKICKMNLSWLLTTFLCNILNYITTKSVSFGRREKLKYFLMFIMFSGLSWYLFNIFTCPWKRFEPSYYRFGDFVTFEVGQSPLSDSSFDDNIEKWSIEFFHIQEDDDF